MNKAIDQLKSTLKASGYSLTHPREAVFMALQNQEPLTMKQLAIACSKIDRASIYRSVLLFEKLNIVQRVYIGWKYKIELSDDFHQHHHHLTCSTCGKVVPFEEDENFENGLDMIAKRQGFAMEGHQLEIQGICTDCQKSAVAVRKS